MIWDEVGEDQFDREKVLLNLEQECLDVYRKKVDGANVSRARLHQELAEAEAEFTHLLLSLGERSLPGRVRNDYPPNLFHQFKSQLEMLNYSQYNHNINHFICNMKRPKFSPNCTC